jgi:biotin transport system substrate-specific component
MTTAAVPLTLADTLPRVKFRDAALVVGGALLTAGMAQISVPLGFTPVPVTGQTLAVLLVGATLGARRAVLSQGLYWLLGMIGLPFYAAGASGWKAATGSTFGYFVGFVVAAALVGHLADRGQDRTFVTSFTAMLAGSVIIYGFGVAWLSYSLNVPFYSGDGKDAFTYGLAPFIAGDLLKLIIAAAITPTAWALLRRSES